MKAQKLFVEKRFIGIKIRTLSGVEGFVFGKYVRSYIDYRASFRKINGKWCIVSIVGGD